jgi:hypothetical protein
MFLTTAPFLGVEHIVINSAKVSIPVHMSLYAVGSREIRGRFLALHFFFFSFQMGSNYVA